MTLTLALTVDQGGGMGRLLGIGASVGAGESLEGLVDDLGQIVVARRPLHDAPPLPVGGLKRSGPGPLARGRVRVFSVRWDMTTR